MPRHSYGDAEIAKVIKFWDKCEGKPKTIQAKLFPDRPLSSVRSFLNSQRFKNIRAEKKYTPLQSKITD